MKKSDADTIHLYEIQPLICAISVPTSITYALDHYDFYIHDMELLNLKLMNFLPVLRHHFLWDLKLILIAALFLEL